jgi:hypothetical protein
VGEEVWERFTGTREQVLWYCREVTEALRRAKPAPGDGLVDELGRVVREIDTLAGARAVSR